jgi:hypothetical protein
MPVIDGSFSKRVLLVGAGFSRNWGGLLASEVSGRILSHSAVLARPALGQLILHEPSFEDALEKSRGSPFEPADAAAIETAITAVFDEMDADYKNPSPPVLGASVRPTVLRQWLWGDANCWQSQDSRSLTGITGCSSRCCFSSDVRLMVIGYGWGDEHINEPIAEAIRHHGLRIYSWNRQHPKDMLAGRSRGDDILRGIMGFSIRAMTEVMPNDPMNSGSTHYDGIVRDFFWSSPEMKLDIS